MKNKILFAFFLIGFIGGTGAAGLQAESVYDAHTRVDLVSENSAVSPGEPFWVAIRLRPDPHWHTYWRNPGDSGLATKVSWSLPSGFQASDLHWPYPRRIDSAGLTSYGYPGEVLLLAEIRPPREVIAPQATLKARVDWLACEVPCLAGKADLSLTLPVSAAGLRYRPAWKALFDLTRAKLPKRAEESEVTAFHFSDRLVLEFPALREDQVASLAFFPYDDGIVHSAPQPRQPGRQHALQLSLQKDPRLSAAKTAPVRGVVVMEQSAARTPRVMEISVTPRVSPVERGPAAGTWVFFVFAFLGGMILNLMPCVFPVMSIKVLNFVNQSQQRDGLGRSVLGYTAGVVATFLSLAVLLIALRSAGETLGWGFQFQSPRFVAGTAFLLFILGLNMFGLFEWRVPAVSGSYFSGRHGGGQAFLSGILAVIVATPCTAPFMGSALSFALTQPLATSLGIFAFLGLGMALPFVVLCLSPGFLKRLPRPGPWMDDFKKGLGFVMMTPVVWLLWVLSGQKESAAVLAVLTGMLSAAFGLWLAGIHQGQGIKRRLLAVVAFLAVAGGILTPLAFIGTLADAGAGIERPGSRGIVWQKYDDELLSRYEQEGKTVFLDFSARWCLTCQVNERLAINTDPVAKAFVDRKVAAVKADWTNHDPKVSAALARFGRASVPTYVVLDGPVNQRRARILPELLTPGIVIKALESTDQ